MEDSNDKKTSDIIEDQQSDEVILPSDVESLSGSKKEKNKITTDVIKDAVRKFFVKAKVEFIDFLDLKKIYDKLPQQWQARIPENRRLVTIPIVLIFSGSLLLAFLWIFAPTADKQKAKSNLPVVRVIDAVKSNNRIPVFSQGVVLPKNEIQLISVVRGPVIYVSPNMVDGGVVRQGETLLKVSPRPYEQDKAKAEANLQRAKAAQVARQSELRVRGTLRTLAGESQLREVNSAVEAAQADVQSMDDLIQQTTIKAPFDGVLRKTNIQKGQMINAAMPIASIFSTDKAVVHLPLSDRQLSLIDIPFQHVENTEINNDSTQAAQRENLKTATKDGETSGGNALDKTVETETQVILFPEVIFSGDFGDQTYTWKGKVIRSAGGRNELNRLQYVVAEIEQPFASDPEQPGRLPLAPGIFVKAEIQGKLHSDLIQLPRAALKSNQLIWLVDKDNQLHSRKVQLLYRGKDYIYVSEGLQGGERVVVSELEVFAEGVEVKAVILDENTSVKVKDSKQNDKEAEGAVK